MACVAAKAIHGTAILQYRVFLIPWSKWNIRTICCAKGRDYSSSSPVKYIPKNSSKNVEDKATSLPLRYLERRRNGPEFSMAGVDISKELSRSCLEVNSMNRDGCLTPDVNCGLHLDVEEEIKGDFLAVTEEFFEEPDETVEGGSKICHGIESGHSRQDVEKSAIKLLASSNTDENLSVLWQLGPFLAFTAKELKKKLQGKRLPVETIDEVITDFQSRGVVNDCLYAETYSRSRWSSSSWGPRRIKQALSKKGINEADAEKAIELVFKNGEGGDSGTSMSKLSMDQLCVQAGKQWQRSRGASEEIRKSRLVRWLQYRGFNWGVIKYVLMKLESGNPS